jgi:hypothetical protein
MQVFAGARFSSNLTSWDALPHKRASRDAFSFEACLSGRLSFSICFLGRLPQRKLAVLECSI